jgi:indoleamine 2,3-dioxygenase
VAVPLVEVAKKIHAKPFMEYALSYALYNYKMVCNSDILTTCHGYMLSRECML